MAIMISASTFVSLFLLFVGILYYVNERAKKLKLLKKIATGEQISDQGVLVSKTNRTMPAGILNLLGRLGKRVASKNSVDYSRMRVQFLRAGFRRQEVLYIFWGIRCFLGILLPGTFFVFRVTVFEIVSLPLTVAILVFLTFLGSYLPEIWLRMRIARRKERISEGFANVLDLLVVCVEAGMGLDAAMNRVGQEIELSSNAWSEELKLFNLELRAGKSRRDALRNLAIRTNVEDVNSLATTLIQTDKFGTSLAQSLRVYSDSFRTKRYQMAEEIAAKLPIKLVFPAILFVFPSLFVVLTGPAAIRVYQVLFQH
jgi:tight adherence protein C